MAVEKLCVIDDCGKPQATRKMCHSHYKLWLRYGDPRARRAAPRGGAEAWIREHADYEGDDCLIWPYSRFRNNYGKAEYQGKTTSAARLMCTIAHGPPPTQQLEAAHSCGRGHDACVNPKHLRWATKKENAADRAIHGTECRGSERHNTKLTEEAVREIRALLGTQTQASIADKYGVNFTVISAIKRGKTWRWLV